MKLRKFVWVLIVGILIAGCKNEDLDDNIAKVNFEELIPESSELFTFLTKISSEESDANPFVCIDFIYPFTLSIYTEGADLLFQEVITDDISFSLALGRVEENQYIGMSFPIATTLDDGSTFEITNKDELKAAIDACVVTFIDQALEFGEGLIVQCVWEVAPREGDDPDTYENAVFEVKNTGNVDFYHRGSKYDGNWIMYFIEDELHLNINLNDSLSVGLDWNFDWKLNIPDDATMEISQDDTGYLLQKECEEGAYCTVLRFEACELPDAPGTAEFLLEEYLPCIDIIAAPQMPEVDFLFTFYTTLEAAENNGVAIDTSVPYINIENPETLFVRIQHPETGEFSVVEMLLVATECAD